jgi:hypothetical protein
MVDTTEVVEESRPGPTRLGAPVVVPRRVRLAQALALVALVAALIGAVGPADHLRTTYSWPPQELPSGTPSRVWYTPLLLVRRVPESVSARIPCSLSRALPAAARPLTVLATARYPDRNRGLAVTRSEDELAVRIGDQTLTSVALPRFPAGGECAFDLRIAGGRWSLEGGPDRIALGGNVAAMPVVNGLFSALDLRSGTPPTIAVTTAVHDSRANVRQTVAWVIAVLGALAALLLVAIERRPRRPWAVLTGAVRAARMQLRVVDAVVSALLLGWWVIAPVSYDDGWVLTRTQNYSASGGFSAYFNALGANQPLGYWLEWLQHWLSEATSALLFLRLPALLCLAATWVLCRWIFSRILAATGGGDGIALWALTCGFAVGAMAWGMTLRPEPFVALLVTGVLACTVRFLERETVAPLALSAVLIALAIPAHPAGIVALAPLLAAAPVLARWARDRLAVAVSIVFASGALVVVLAILGSDLDRWNADIEAQRAYGDATANWREEVLRYANLFETPIFASPMRHMYVALLALAVVAYVLRRRRTVPVLLNLPSVALAVSLVLLVFTPSKRPWHFGTMLGIAAVAVAVETMRLRSEARRSDRGRALPFLAVGAAVFAASWAWSPRGPWNNLDLQTLDWILGFERRMSLTTLAGILPLVLLGVATFFELARHHRDRLPDVPWRVASWTVPALAVPVIAFTAGVLIVDAARTDSWTVTRQNIDTLTGDLGCGLADDAVVPSVASMRLLAVVDGKGASRPIPAWVPPPPAADLDRFALVPARGTAGSSPWFDVSGGQPFGVFAAGSSELLEGIAVEWGTRRGNAIESLGIDELPREADVIAEARPDLVSWRFLSTQELPPPEQGATAARFLLPSSVAPGSAVAVTAPVAYANERLLDRFGGSGARSLVMPNMLMYLPCARQPRLEDGTVEVPRQVVAFLYSWPVGLAASPFTGVSDLYTIQRLPLTDVDGAARGSVVYDVDPRIPGARTAEPEKTTN